MMNIFSKTKGAKPQPVITQVEAKRKPVEKVNMIKP